MVTRPPHETSRHPQHRHRHRRPFLENGLGALALGGLFLLLSALLHHHPPLSTAARALQVPAWFLLGVSVLLLGIHYVLKDRPDEDGAEATSSSLLLSTFDRQRPTAAWAPSGPQRTRAAATQPVVARSRPSAPTRWSAAVFAAIEWRRFEAVCEALFAQPGLSTHRQSQGPSDGVDLWLCSSAPHDTPVRLVRCKQWQSRQVDVYELRDFFEVMLSLRLKRGTYLTTSGFTPDAPAFARTHGIHLLDGAAVLKLIAQHPPEQQQALLQVAFEGDYARPTCPRCDIKMVERVRSKDGVSFWACLNRSRCQETLPMGRHGA